MTRPIEPDPNVLSVPEAAALMGVNPRTLRDQFRDDPAFRDRVSVVIGKTRFVSKVRLSAYLHGETVAS